MLHRYRTYFRIALLSVTFATANADESYASGCGITSAQIAQSRPYAIAQASRGNLATALAIAGSDHYLAGLLAYIGKEPHAALSEFSQALIDSQNLPGTQRSEQIAAIAYWSAKAFSANNDKAAARQALAAAAEEPNTFYGELASRASIASDSYPRPNYNYIDNRTTKALVWAIIWVESRFQTEAISNADALGLMQLLPETAREIAQNAGATLDEEKLLTNPVYNVAIGSTYLGTEIEHYNGYLPLAISAYNAGPECTDEWVAKIGDPRTNVDPLLWIEAIPLNETRRYVQSVLAAYILYADSPTK
jgi:soluble lytic murein transglycosylase-like protein